MELKTGLRAVGVMLLLISTVALVFSAMPSSLALMNGLGYQTKRSLNMLDVSLVVVDPSITAQVVDGIGTQLTQLNVGSGTKIFMKGTLVDKTSNQGVEGILMHLYAQIGSTYVTGAYCSSTTAAANCEWDEEVTVTGGQWDTRSVSATLGGNEMDWLIVASDGVYKNGDPTLKYWSGDPSGKTISFFATTWAGDGSFKGKTDNINIPIGTGQSAFNPQTSIKINECGPYVGVGDLTTSCSLASPLSFSVQYTSQADQVGNTKVFWVGNLGGSQQLTRKATDSTTWEGSVTLTPGTYVVQVVAYSNGGVAKTVLDFTYTQNTATGGSVQATNTPPQTGLWVMLAISGIVASVVILVVSREVN